MRFLAREKSSQCIHVYIFDHSFSLMRTPIVVTWLLCIAPAEGSLPPSFTRQIRGHTAYKSRRTRQALLSTAVVECTPPRSPVTTAAKPIGSILSSPDYNSAMRTLARSFSPSPVHEVKSSRKRPRTTHSCLREDVRGEPYSAAAASLEQYVGGQWEPNGGTSKTIETDWACSSSAATSITSHHDGFSDLFARTAAGEPERLGFNVRTRYLVEPATGRPRARTAEVGFQLL